MGPNYTKFIQILVIFASIFNITQSLPKINHLRSTDNGLYEPKTKSGGVDWIKLGTEIGSGIFEKISSPKWESMQGRDVLNGDRIYQQRIGDRTVYKISGTFAYAPRLVGKAIKFLEDNQKTLAPIGNAKILKMECAFGPVRAIEFLFLNEGSGEVTENEIIGSGGIAVYPQGRNDTKFDMLFDLELEEWSGINPLVLTATLLPDFMRSILFAQQMGLN